MPDLPPEIWMLICEYVDDWEVAYGLGITPLETNKNSHDNGNMLMPRRWRGASKGDLDCLSGNNLIYKDQSYTRLAVLAAAKFGYINTLQQLKLYHPSIFSNQGHTFPLPGFIDTEHFCDAAAAHGRVEVLNWWLTSGLKLDHTMCAMNMASENNHEHVLNWFLCHKVETKYSPAALNKASGNGHINILDWWKASGLPLAYNLDAVNLASSHGRVDVLEWWKNSGLSCSLTYDAIYYAMMGENWEVIDWWKRSGLKVRYGTLNDSRAQTLLSRNREAIEWWRQSL